MMSLFGTKFSTPLAGGSRDSGDGRPRSGFTSGSNVLPSGSAVGGGGAIAVAGFSGTLSSTNVLLPSGSPRGGGGAPRSGGGIGGPRSGGAAAAFSGTSGSNALPSGRRSPTPATVTHPDGSGLSASNNIVGATLDEESRSLPGFPGV